MSFLLNIIKDYLIPGSVAFLLLGLAAGVALLYAGERGRRIGRIGLTVLTVLYFLLTLPLVSTSLTIGLQPDGPEIRTPADANGSRALVIFGNGVVTYENDGLKLHPLARWTLLSALEAARVYRIIQPEWVIASGGIPDPNSQTLPESSVIRDTLGPLGVPAERVILESDSVNTSEQVANVAKLLERRHIAGTVVFVTSPHHSKRVMLLARRHGINAIISPAERATFDPLLGWDTWRPSVGNLRRSEMAIYEYLAWVKDWMVASW